MKWKKLFLLFLFLPLSVFAKDCCTNHGGNSFTCSLEGSIVCNDGFVCKNTSCIITAPTPTSAPFIPETPKRPNSIQKIYGCTDKSAKNYDKNANTDNGKCTYYRYGCTDKEAFNYDASAEKDDGSCKNKVYGCTDKNAKNYNEQANINDGKCRYELIREVDEEKPYKIKIIKDKKLYVGNEKLIQKGITGRYKVKYQILLNGEGKEVSKKVLKKTVLRETQDKIIKEGKKDSLKETMLFLYFLAAVFVLFELLFIRKDTSHFYFFSEILDYQIINSRRLTFLIKILLFILYFTFVLPVFMDIILYILNLLDMRI